MRLLERTLRWVTLSRRMTREDDLGGVTEAFSQDGIRVRASVIPSGINVLESEAGCVKGGSACLLLPLDVQVEPGDGFILDGDEGRWRCTEVQRWSAHQAVRIARIL